MKAEAIEARAECGSRDCKGDYMGAEYRQKWLSSLGGYVVYRHWFDIDRVALRSNGMPPHTKQPYLCANPRLQITANTGTR